MTEFLLSLLLIIAVARFVGRIVTFIGQPRVVGEMLTGLLLGPSILGVTHPEIYSLLSVKFNEVLYLLSQLGLALYMFVVGLELDNKVFKRKNLNNSLLIATSSLVIAFILSFITSWFLYKQFDLPNISKINFSIFMACGFSLTAFPMLARILQERNLSNTNFGSTILVAASLDDATAWILLAFMTAIINSEGVIAVFYITLKLLLFLVTMLYIVKPILSKIITENDLGQSKFSLILIVLLGSTLMAEMIGIHVVFGGFIAGIIIPRNPEIRKSVEQRLQDFVTVFLVPIFFVYSGMNTTLSVFGDISMMVPLVIYLVIAIIGKYSASMLVAKSIGFNWKESSAIGALMNARGLMILIFGNIGISYNLISTEVYSIIVIVAIITTSMTYPLFNLSYPQEKAKINLRAIINSFK